METIFKNISKIKYEGPKSKNPLAFKHYNPAEVVEGKTMREQLRFSVVYWHTFRNALSDPFGVGTAVRPWDDGSDSVANAENRARVAFEFIEKLGAPFYAFHDRDVAPEGGTLRETNKNLDAVVKVLKAEQQRTGIKLLWGTANLFSNPRFVHGASTSCNADVFAFAAAQVKKALEVTHELGGVAGLDVLGVRFGAAGHPVVTAILAGLAAVVWLVLTYGVPAGLLLARERDSVLGGVNGSGRRGWSARNPCRSRHRPWFPCGPRKPGCSGLPRSGCGASGWCCTCCSSR